MAKRCFQLTRICLRHRRAWHHVLEVGGGRPCARRGKPLPRGRTDSENARAGFPLTNGLDCNILSSTTIYHKRPERRLPCLFANAHGQPEKRGRRKPGWSTTPTSGANG